MYKLRIYNFLKHFSCDGVADYHKEQDNLMIINVISTISLRTGPPTPNGVASIFLKTLCNERNFVGHS